MKSENNLYMSIIQELTNYFINIGFKVRGKTKFYKKSNFGNWNIIVNVDSKKDSVFILSYKIGYRINEIKKIYKQIFTVKSNDKQTALFDLGLLMGLHTSYEQYVTTDVNHYDITIDFDYHYKKFLKDLFDSYDNSIDIISSTFDNGILSEICNYSSLKKAAFLIWKEDFYSAVTVINNIPQTVLSEKNKVTSIDKIIELEKKSEINIK